MGGRGRRRMSTHSAEEVPDEDDELTWRLPFAGSKQVFEEERLALGVEYVKLAGALELVLRGQLVVDFAFAAGVRVFLVLVEHRCRT